MTLKVFPNLNDSMILLRDSRANFEVSLINFFKEFKNMISVSTGDGTQRSKKSCPPYGLRPIW